MNAHVREEILALYVRGDLPENELRRVARHIGECLDCEQVLADLSLSCELFTKSLKDPTAVELADLRSAVMGKLRAGAADSRSWVWMFAAAAAALLCMAALIWRGERREFPPVARLPQPGPPAVTLPPEPPMATPRTQVARAPRKRIAPGMRAATLITKAGQPNYLKMNTSDPNVVILWQVQENEKVATP
ncbi:MAG TPA: zf-HC2 domain-containing protein [Bryobacteraceae bacterium]|jgi:hypothetical protein